MDYKHNFIKWFAAVLIVCCALAGCSRMISWIFQYEVANESGHTVSIVIRPPRCPEFPDSLGLHNGERYNFSWKMDEYDEHSLFNEYHQLDVGLIYYDNRYVIQIEDLPADREFRKVYGSYVKIGDEPPHFVYIFTEADYLYAVEHGVDLGAEHEIRR